MEPDCPAIIENCIVLCHLLPIGQALAVVTSTFIIVADIEPRDFSSIKDYVLIIGDCYSLKIWIEADVNRKRAVRFVAGMHAPPRPGPGGNGLTKMNYQDGKREVGEEAGKKWQKYNFSFV